MERLAAKLLPSVVNISTTQTVKASGIRNSDAGRSLRRATWIAAEMKIASAPIFFMNAESSATQATNTPTWRFFDLINGLR